MTHFSSFRRLGSLVSLLGLGGFALLGAACQDAGTPDEDVGSDGSALTAAQCSYFDINGKVQICHKTSSAAHPYTILRLSEQGCINGHVAHGGDYVASTDPASPLYDPTCSGGGCLPVTAPCDATLPCCDGSTCTDGVCVGTPPDPCDGVTCVAIDQCHVAGTCDSDTGACSSPAASNGTACNDGSDCTSADTCSDGACTGSGSPCQNGASCDSNGAGYTCACGPAWTGTNCETAVDLCTEPCPLPSWADDECTVAPCDPATGVCGDLDYYTHLNELCNGNTGACSGGVCHSLPPTCESVACANGGECVDNYCSCPSGYEGTHCEQVTPVELCPCATAFDDFMYAGYAGSYDTCFVTSSSVDIAFDKGPPYVGVSGGNCYYVTTTSGVFPVGAVEEQACRDRLLMLDESVLGLCSP